MSGLATLLRPLALRALPPALLPAILLAGAGALPATPDLVIDCERARVPPAIDGDLAEWTGAPWVAFSPGPAARPRPAGWLGDDGATEPPGTAGTEADLSGRVALRWDADFLYLAAEVRDNVIDVDGDESYAWYQRDGITLFLDVRVDGDGPGWVTGDHAFSFAADTAGTAPDSRWWRRGTPQGHRETRAPEGVSHRVRRTADGYRLEGRVPLALLSATAPERLPPATGLEVGFLFLVTDPDGGPRAFGGQLMVGGSGDDDGDWGRLRFVDAGAGRPPRLEPSVAWRTFRTRLDLDLAFVGPFFGKAPTTPQQDSLQSVLGDWYFGRYLEARPSRLARKALWMASTLWGNAGDVARLRVAVDSIGPGEDVWEEVVPGLRRGYLQTGRGAEGMQLLEALLQQVEPLKSRSVILFALAEYWVGQGERARARRALSDIVLWRASPWYVERAFDLLRELQPAAGAADS